MGSDKIQQNPVRKTKLRFIQKNWIIIVTVTIIIAVGGAVNYWLFVSNQTVTIPQNINTSDVTDATDQTDTNAEILANNGDITGAKTLYDDAINQTDDPIDKSSLLLSKATVSFNAGNYDDALLDTKQAEALDNNVVITGFIAQIYEKKGDKQKAIEYYQKAITLVDIKQPLSGDDIKHYQSKIQLLGGAN